MKFFFDRFLIFAVLSLDDFSKIDSFLRKSMRILPFMYQNRAGGVGEKMKGSLSVKKMTSTFKKSSLSTLDRFLVRYFENVHIVVLISCQPPTPLHAFFISTSNSESSLAGA